jgi:predicted MFS family arabinose efflux permease
MALVFAATVANRWFVARRGLVIGGLTAATATGQLIFLPGLSKLAEIYSWKSISITISLASIAVVPFVFLFLREKPADVGLLPYGAPTDWQPPAKSEIPAGKLAVVTLKEASKKRDFWFLTGSFFVCGLSTSGLIGTHFIPAAHDHGMAEPVAASLLALIGVFDVIGTLASGWLTDRFDPRKLLLAYYGLRGLSLFLLPSILFSTMHPSTLVFVIFYGLDWVATVPPTIMLCRQVLGPTRATVVYGWVFAAHQIGGSVAAFGAAVMRVQFGDYALAFYISGLMCLITAYFVLQIAKGVPTEELKK